MKNQIKIFCLCLLMFFSINSFSQSFGIKGGLNLSNMKIEDEGGSVDFKIRPGFHVGVIAEFGGKFAFAPELLLSTYGAKIDEVDGSGAIKLLYANIPLNLKYTHDLGSAKIFVFAGPYLGVALKGTDEWEGETIDYSFGNDEMEDDFKRTDFGANFGAGLQLDKIFFNFSYGLSLTTIVPQDYTFKNNLIAISIGYKFK
jgi:hypothetical protein